MTIPHETDLEHPTESELAERLLGELDDARSNAISGHLRACASCRILAGRFERGLPELPAGVPSDEPRGAVPDEARAAIASADRPEAGPRPGELWRARRHPDGPVTMVWLRDVAGAGTAAVPVSLDTELADERTLIVPPAASPLGTPLAVHVGVEATIDERHLLDRLGSLDIAADVASLHAAWLAGEPGQELDVGPVVVSPLDERIEYREALADRLAELAPAGVDDAGAREQRALDEGATHGGGPEDWGLPATGSVRAELLMVLHQALRDNHAAARVVPRPPAATGSEHLDAIALVAELDAFVLVASVEGGGPLQGPAPLESARWALHADQVLSAVCIVDPVDPFMAVVIDRRDVVDAIETPSGQLRPPRQSRPPAPVGDALVKFLDAAITPFGRLAGTIVTAEAVDPRGLAADVTGEAVRSVAGSARAYKVEGKRPGYERVSRHHAAIARLVEAALGDATIDVAAIMELDE
jgi:hypothetical protein